MSHRPVVGLVATASALIVAVSPIHAEVVPDQAYHEAGALVYATISHPNLAFERAQTITVGVTGMLHHVDVLLAPNSTPSALRLLSTSGGLPTEILLGSSSVMTALGDGWTSFDFSGLGLLVTAGDVLALETVGWGTWEGIYGNGYPAGTGVFRYPDGGTPYWTVGSEPLDLFFRSYVDVLVTRTARASWGSLKRSHR